MELTPTHEQHSQPIADEAAFRRVQQTNQPQVVAKLLHDLRNPVHSMRITVELFGRIVQSRADASALLSRAARYVAPAEAAISTLSKQTERLAIWLGPPAQPRLQPLEVNDWLAEIAALVRDSSLALDAKVESGLSDQVRLSADRPRLSHAFLNWCLSARTPIVLSAAEEADHIRLTAGLATEPDEDVRTLIERSGGQYVRNAGRAAALIFQRA
jgi:signal transduction histidine kinase